MRYTPESREQVREAIDFVELVGARTELRAAGARRFIGLCPFHDERSPSFGIDPVEKLYHCFGCGAGGDLFQFVMETDSLDFTEALELLAERTNVKLEPVSEDPRQAQKRERRARLLQLMERTADYYIRTLWEASEAATAREYLLGRGLTEETLREFRLGYAPSAWDKILIGSQRSGFTVEELRAVGLVIPGRSGGLYDRFRGRIIFPLTDTRGSVIGFGARALRDNQQPKYLNSPESELFHKGRWLYAADRARSHSAKAGEVIVVEGYTDVIALHQAGFRNTVGVMGTALTENQANELSRLAPTITLCLDADAAGQEAIARAAQLLRRRERTLRVVALPANLDPAELVTRSGHEAMQALLSGTVSFERFEVGRLLNRSDLSSASGRDEALASTAELIRPLAPSVLRDDLVQLVSNKLGLGESLVGAALGSSNRRSTRDFQPNLNKALGRREQTERSFLALCIALPDEGRALLDRLDIDSIFSSLLLKRAAHYLQDRLESPGAGLADADSELTGLVSELVIRARQVDVSVATLELEGLQLELARAERRIAAAKSDGADTREIVLERERIQADIRKRLQ